MTTKIAIKGSKDFPQLVIKMLEQAGGENPYKHIGNDVTGYYYNNSHNEIVCNNPNDIPDEYEKYSFENSIRPILFSTEMVKAILEGRKTQTRREVKPQPEWDQLDVHNGKLMRKGGGVPSWYETGIKCPYGKPGDILWVRETYGRGVSGKYYYKTDESFVDQLVLAWKPSIHMPKAACRIFLKVKSVRVERLQDITPIDAAQEGIEIDTRQVSVVRHWLDYQNKYKSCTTAVGSFMSLWKFINGPESWDANPWVWVIEFEVI